MGPGQRRTLPGISPGLKRHCAQCRMETQSQPPRGAWPCRIGDIPESAGPATVPGVGRTGNSERGRGKLRLWSGNRGGRKSHLNMELWAAWGPGKHETKN